MALLAVLLLSITTSCTWPGQTGTQTTGPTASLSPLPAGPEPTSSAPPASVQADTSPVPATQHPITITLWIPDTFNGGDATPEWEALTGMTAGFQSENPTLRVHYVRKQANGSAGIIDFLRSARDVAPSVLPDLVILPTDQVDMAIQAGLLQPADNLLTPVGFQDLYGFASTSTVNKHLMALGFAVDIEHLAYDPIRLDHPPSTLQDVLAQKQRFLFPAGGENGQVNDVTLIHYLAAGGKLIDSQGNATLDREPLKRVFAFYEQALTQGIIPSDTLQLNTTDDAWNEYLKGKAAMTVVNSHRFLIDGLRRKTTSFAPLPTLDGNVGALASGWSIGLITDDTDRQNVAALYVAWLLNPQVLGSWCQKTGHLPAIRSALPVAVSDEAYRAFLNTQLESAGVRSNLPAASKSQNALQRALQSLLNGTLSASDAVEFAINALQ
ncbi:MAG: extracellular solute-binding protein [Chloroflexi bacterium]|nr:extracellular solute-binding protein [Chloroflexota bacterium]